MKDAHRQLIDKNVSDFEKNNNLNSNQINNKQKNERLGIFHAVIFALYVGLVSFHIKLSKILFEDEFDTNLFMFYRSFPAIIISLISMHYNNEKLYPISDIKNKFWFFLRILFNYPSILFLVFSMLYLRAATATCLSSSVPIFIIILSIFILNEKFYWKYLLGVIICFLGATMIVLNERKDLNDIDDTDDKNLSLVDEKRANILYGCVCGGLHILFKSLNTIGQKIIAV